MEGAQRSLHCRVAVHQLRRGPSSDPPSLAVGICIQQPSGRACPSCLLCSPGLRCPGESRPGAPACCSCALRAQAQWLPPLRPSRQPGRGACPLPVTRTLVVVTCGLRCCALTRPRRWQRAPRGHPLSPHSPSPLAALLCTARELKYVYSSGAQRTEPLGGICIRVPTCICVCMDHVYLREGD